MVSNYEGDVSRYSPQIPHGILSFLEKITTPKKSFLALKIRLAQNMKERKNRSLRRKPGRNRICDFPEVVPMISCFCCCLAFMRPKMLLDAIKSSLSYQNGLQLTAKSGHTGYGVASITLAYADILQDRRASLQPILLVRGHFY